MKNNDFSKKYSFDITQDIEKEKSKSASTGFDNNALMEDINSLSKNDKKHNMNKQDNSLIETDMNLKYKQLINKSPYELVYLKINCYKRLFTMTYKYFYDNEFTTFRNSVYVGISILFLSNVTINLAYFFHPLKRSLILLSFIASFALIGINWNKNLEELITQTAYDETFRKSIGKEVKDIKNELILYNPFNKYYK